MIVAPIPVRTWLVDTVAALTLQNLTDFKTDGCGGVIAYLGGNLTKQLIADAHSLDLGIVPVNYSHKEGWMPTAALGAQDAKQSADHMSALGIPMLGLDDWCDIEGCGGVPTAYCEAWCAALAADGAGRVPGEYVGAGSLLGGHAHYMLPFKGYWHSCSAAIPEPDCGFKMFQIYPPNQMLAGVEVDYDFVARDFRGRAPTWVVSGA